MSNYDPVGNKAILNYAKSKYGTPSWSVPEEGGDIAIGYQLGYTHGHEDGYLSAWREAEEAIDALNQHYNHISQIWSMISITMKRLLWNTLGMFFVGLGYIGVIVPGVPTTIFLIIATWCFTKGSPKFHAWLINHPKFGSVIRDWYEKRVFPRCARWAMMSVMCLSLVIMWFTNVNQWVLTMTALCMAGVVVWAYRYPGSVCEYHQRVKNNKPTRWLK